MRYLLDTCAFLWMSQQPVLLSATATEVINERSHELFVSEVSIWEITLKHSSGKLPLPGVPRVWIPRKFEVHQFKSLRLEADAIYRSGELPRVHADPFDRLIAAQAMENGMTILSPDIALSVLGASRIW
jgi:PIN domain nuclease of toxin-antitoxin system